MDAFHAPHSHLLSRPFPRRLTKMYTDTKSSYDFVKEPVQSAEDPEVSSLHRKLRIQKDRLVSWGLEWSDTSQSPDIDESINKAGLADLVVSVMATIKEILAEVEPLWNSSKGPLSDGRPSSLEKSIDRKPSLIIWDKSRFQDLLRDLTMSIDTLYDLSRTRQSARKASMKLSEASGGMQSKAPIVEEKLFESTRMQTPQQIDPASLIWPTDLKNLAPGMIPPAKSPRQIVFMRRPTNAPDARKSGSQALPTLPVLLEQAPYDSIYSITGISPSLSRFERLFAALSQPYISSDRVLAGLFRLIGYYEEPEQSRFCLLFALPTHFGPIDIESPRIPSITMLSDLLYSNSYEPTLEIKYRLAHNITNAIFDLHSKGVVHGNIVASNILFIEHQSSNRIDLAQVNMRQPYVASFDLFSDNATDGSENKADAYTLLHRHPLDPRTTRYTRLTTESKSLDLYSLALLLVEIGLWTNLSEVFKSAVTIPENPTAVLKNLAARCGSVYVKAVQACWHAPDDELSQKTRPDIMHQKVSWKVSKALDTCCSIDESSEDSGEDSDDALQVAIDSVASIGASLSIRDQKTPAIASIVPTPPPRSEKSPAFASDRSRYNEPATSTSILPPTTDVKAPKPKLKTYPAIRISQEHLDYWHTGLMPSINHVLRGFYKNYAESIEISLESIGATSASTKPTILVICTSVNKVRSLLKKSLVYDKDVYGLKVCRGKVVRSRKRGVKRSMAYDSSDFKPLNAKHQDRPSNGASIGAYVGERHLPPVSFGGMVLVDDKPYGLTVHHMLDDPDDAEEEDESEEITAPILRSSAHEYEIPDLTYSDSSVYSSGDEEYTYSISDYDSDDVSSEISDASDLDSNFSDDDSTSGMEPGDVKGIPQGCGEEYLITQPGLDDVPEDFFPSEETRDEDHLDSFQLGEVYASSGIRRRTENGMVHEIDWALFDFQSHREPPGNNLMHSQRNYTPEQYKATAYPTSVAPVAALADLEVHCVARTSGLQTGRILPGMVIVKIFGRQTPSCSYQVAGQNGKLGIPGDSGAWVVDNQGERACGHVLAWSSRKGVAYICPMDVILRDIGETLGASSVRLPGGDNVWTGNGGTEKSVSTLRVIGEEQEEETEPDLVAGGSAHDNTTPTLPKSVGLPTSNVSIQPLNYDPEVVQQELASMLTDLKLPPTPSQIDDDTDNTAYSNIPTYSPFSVAHSQTTKNASSNIPRISNPHHQQQNSELPTAAAFIRPTSRPTVALDGTWASAKDEGVVVEEEEVDSDAGQVRVRNSLGRGVRIEL